MTTTHGVVITSTSGLTPAGILGYSKAIAAYATALLVAITPLFGMAYWLVPWVQMTIGLIGAAFVCELPNHVEPLRVIVMPEKHDVPEGVLP